MDRKTVLEHMERRRDWLRNHIDEQDLHGAVIVDENLRHWLGFGRSALVLAREATVEGATWDTAAEFLSTAKPRMRIGYEADLSHKHALALDPEQRLTWVRLNKGISPKTAIKDQLELTLLQLAARRTVSAVERVMSETEPGVTENDLLHRISAHLRSENSDIIWAFDPSVAVDERTTLIWAGVTNRRSDGGAVLIDVGIRVGGYCSDISRSYWLGVEGGPIFDQWCRMRDASHEVLAACLPLMLPDTPVAAVAERCQFILRKQGVDGQMKHLLGHGLGMSIHEVPTIAAESPEVFFAGMVVSVEPGVANTEVGYRYEHPFLVTDEGVRDLLHGEYQ